VTRIFLALALLAACSKSADKAAPAAAADGKVAIAVTKNGFEPADIKVTKGTPVTLVFTRKTDETCAKDVVIHVDDKQTIEKDLPLNAPVEVAVTFPNSGDLVYACGMDMVKGHIHVN
jgi:plastocyanin domain-containing protein